MFPNIDLKHLTSLVVEELRNLKGDRRLDITNIRNGEQLLFSKKIDTSDLRYHGGGDTVEAGDNIIITNDEGKKRISSTSSPNFVDNEVVASTGDPFVFQLAFDPILNSQHIYLTGLRKTPDVQYTISGRLITFESVNDPGSVLADYRKLI